MNLELVCTAVGCVFALGVLYPIIKLGVYLQAAANRLNAEAGLIEFSIDEYEEEKEEEREKFIERCEDCLSASQQFFNNAVEMVESPTEEEYPKLKVDLRIQRLSKDSSKVVNTTEPSKPTTEEVVADKSPLEPSSHPDGGFNSDAEAEACAKWEAENATNTVRTSETTSKSDSPSA